MHKFLRHVTTYDYRSDVCMYALLESPDYTLQVMLMSMPLFGYAR